MAYLDHDELINVRNAALAAGLVDGTRRPMLFDGVMPAYVAALPMLAAPLDQVHQDLLRLNQVDRLLDGRVPLELWLRNAVEMTTVAEPHAVLDAALDRVTGEAAGEPPIASEDVDEMPEAIVFQDDTVAFDFLQRGHEAGAAVALLRVPQYEGGAPRRQAGLPSPPHLGTAWVLSPELIMTNHHVVLARKRSETPPSEADLREQGAHATALFDFDDDGPQGTPVEVSALEVWDPTLDYAVLRLAERSDRRPLQISPEALVVGGGVSVPVNIIQHPGGNTKRVGLRNNLIERSTETRLRYFTDTRKGSSGSPVLNDQWQVVALHRAAERAPGVKFQGKESAVVNVGSPIHAVLADLAVRAPKLHAEITA